MATIQQITTYPLQVVKYKSSQQVELFTTLFHTTLPLTSHTTSVLSNHISAIGTRFEFLHLGLRLLQNDIIRYPLCVTWLHAEDVTWFLVKCHVMVLCDFVWSRDHRISFLIFYFIIIWLNWTSYLVLAFNSHHVLTMLGSFWRFAGRCEQMSRVISKVMIIGEWTLIYSLISNVNYYISLSLLSIPPILYHHSGVKLVDINIHLNSIVTNICIRHVTLLFTV